LGQLLPKGAAVRRAAAKFDGLLRTGRNRKKLRSEVALSREDVGPLTLPEKQP
jgi:hypothetical protein